MKASSIFILNFYLLYSIVESQLGSDCITPNEEKAYCFPLKKCDHLKQPLLHSTLSSQKFLNASICGSILSRELLVCCGLSSDFKTINYATLLLDTLPSSAKISALLPRICGNQAFQNRIFGGNETGIDEFPWMALMAYRNKLGDNSGFQCGGVLISSRYVLTAAHCVVGSIEKISGKLFSVRLGEYDMRTEQDCVEIDGDLDCADPYQDILVEDIVVHEDYMRNVSGTYNDIALVRLAREVEFTDFIKPICLPLHEETSKTGETLYAAGWGKIENGSYSPVKLKVDLNKFDLDECSQRYTIYKISLTKRQICALGDKGKDTCSGDSGGPLMKTISDNDTRWYVEGLVSFGSSNCNTEGLPGVYTSVPRFIDWIIDYIQE